MGRATTDEGEENDADDAEQQTPPHSPPWNDCPTSPLFRQGLRWVWRISGVITVYLSSERSQRTTCTMMTTTMTTMTTITITTTGLWRRRKQRPLPSRVHHKERGEGGENPLLRPPHRNLLAAPPFQARRRGCPPYYPPLALPVRHLRLLLYPALPPPPLSRGNRQRPLDRLLMRNPASRFSSPATWTSENRL